MGGGGGWRVFLSPPPTPSSYAYDINSFLRYFVKNVGYNIQILHGIPALMKYQIHSQFTLNSQVSNKNFQTKYCFIPRLQHYHDMNGITEKFKLYPVKDGNIKHFNWGETKFSFIIVSIHWYLGNDRQQSTVIILQHIFPFSYKSRHSHAIFMHTQRMTWSSVIKTLVQAHNHWQIYPNAWTQLGKFISVVWTHPILSASVAQAPTALVTLTSSAWLVPVSRLTRGEIPPALRIRLLFDGSWAAHSPRAPTTFTRTLYGEMKNREHKVTNAKESYLLWEILIFHKHQWWQMVSYSQNLHVLVQIKKHRHVRTIKITQYNVTRRIFFSHFTNCKSLH